LTSFARLEDATHNPIVSRDEPAESTIEELRVSLGPKSSTRVAVTTVEKFGHLDILVNNAGIKFTAPDNWWHGMPSFEMAIEKLEQAVTCVVRCLAVVFHSMTKQDRSGLEVRVKESVVRAGIDNEIDWRPVVAPAGYFVGAVCRRRPIVEGPDEDDRGYSRTGPCLLTWRIERSRRLESQVAWWVEQFQRIGLCHKEANPGASREADRSHTAWIDEGLASQED
jgi:hypothetical protein